MFSSPKAGQAWGMFMTDTEPVTPQRGEPSYHKVAPGIDDRLSAIKVSLVGNMWDTVLVAKLGFTGWIGADVTEADGLVHCTRLFFHLFFDPLFPSMFQHIHSRCDWN
jgi:hypothetical protein